MERHGIFLTFLILFTVTVVCFGAEQEMKPVHPNSRTEQNNTSTSKESSVVKSGPKSDVVDNKDKFADPVSVSQDGTKNVPRTDNPSKELNSKEAPKVGTDKDHSTDKSRVKEENTKKGTRGGSESKMVPKGKGVTTDGNADPLKPLRKESARGEECDSSSTCTDQKNKLIACLRVPGNDSPELSLLIQNKGTSPLSVKISAPESVQLENSSVQIPENEHKKVKISIGKDNKNTLIVLTVEGSEGSNCTIDYRDLIPHDSGKKANDSTNSAFNDLTSKVPLVLLISIGTVMLVGSACMYVRYRRKNPTSDNSKYQKLETELPLSGVGKRETDVEDGWDENWGDSWDDEEAPKTPSMPITPSLSSKGLASRKLTKDSWKD